MVLVSTETITGIVMVLAGKVAGLLKEEKCSNLVIRVTRCLTAEAVALEEMITTTVMELVVKETGLSKEGKCNNRRIQIIYQPLIAGMALVSMGMITETTMVLAGKEADLLKEERCNSLQILVMTECSNVVMYLKEIITATTI